MKRIFFYFAFLVLFVSCGGDDPIGDLSNIGQNTVPVTGSIMYINNFGQPHILDITYPVGDNSGSSIDFDIQPWVRLNDRAFEGPTAVFDSIDYKGVDFESIGTYDWGTFDVANNQSPNMGVILREPTGFVNDYRRQVRFSYLGVTDFQKFTTLRYHSQIKDELQDLVTYQFFMHARNVKFIDRNRFIVFYSEWIDRWGADVRPVGSDIINYIHYAIRYDIRTMQARDRTAAGEVIFATGQNHYARGQTVVSARGNFYYMFGRVYNTTGKSPYVVNADGTGFAYVPEIKGNQGYNRAPGNEAFAYEAHPRKDSVIAVADAVWGIGTLQIPNSKHDRFIEIDKLQDFRSVTPNGWNATEAFTKDRWFLRFSPRGDKLAIAHYGSYQDVPKFYIWYVGQKDRNGNDVLLELTFPSLDGLPSSIGAPAWDVDSPEGQDYIYVVAANEAIERAGFYYRAIPETPTESPIQFQTIGYSQLNYANGNYPQNQELTRAVHLVQKKINLE